MGYDMIIVKKIGCCSESKIEIIKPDIAVPKSVDNNSKLK